MRKQNLGAVRGADDLKDSEVSYNTYFYTDDTKLHSRGKKLKLTLVEGNNIEAIGAQSRPRHQEMAGHQKEQKTWQHWLSKEPAKERFMGSLSQGS